ncbi:Protease HtpX [Tepidimonas thermarum]|uniref:Protease HtpX n=1 Tax=Tepidimonas thermarum TaxID=335431 RepID=A0A554X660_9BURK|nr:M48 family metallopeptidase [Tepidimonas thermarum]TSE31330.1 Protease HtpX [Tepidimonas thermarum]
MDAPLPLHLVWTWTFVALVLAALLLRGWLYARQVRHVARHRNRVPDAFAQHVSADQHAKAAAYTIDKTRLALFETVWGSALLIGWTLLGGLDALNQMLLAWLGEGLVQQVALVGAFFLIGAVLELPLAWWRTFRVEAAHGFNHTTPALWVADGLKGTLVAAALGLPLAALVLWLYEAVGPWWWLWAWAAWMAFNTTLLLLYPRVIAPLFNRFEPLADASLRARVEALLARCGFRAAGVYVMDGSRRSAHANAYFTGFGPAKRVVLFDTLLQRLDAPEVDAVLAHELGHAHHRHVLKRLLWLAAGSAAALAVLGWLSQQLWFYFGLGVTPSLTGSNGALALLLFGMVLPLLGIFVAPLASALSRRDEYQADRYAARHAGAAALTSALLRLYRDNAATLTPDPLFVRFFYSHPPAADRLAQLARLHPPHSDGTAGAAT